MGLGVIPDAVAIAVTGSTSTKIRYALEQAEALESHTFTTRWVLDPFVLVIDGVYTSTPFDYRSIEVYMTNSEFVESVEAAIPVNETRERMYIESLRYLAYDRAVEGIGISGALDLGPSGDRDHNFWYRIYNNTDGIDEAIEFFE